MSGDLTSRVFAEASMGEAEAFEFGSGRAVVFSMRSPSKETANEDGAGVLPASSKRGVLAVADGLGGCPMGASASRVAISRLAERVSAAGDQEGGLRGPILDALEDANAELVGNGSGAATTAALVEIDGRTLRAYHVGDSAIYVVGQRGRIKLQTVAHSPVGYAIEAGLLDETEALHHEERHLISNVVGSADMRVEIGSPVELAPRDTVLIATDGLFDNLTPVEIVEIIRTKPLEVVAAELIERSRRRMVEPREGEPSKHDDLTFVLFRLNVPKSKAAAPRAVGRRTLRAA